MNAVLVGSNADALRDLRTTMVGEGLGVRDVTLTHQFFGHLGDFAACLIVIQWPLTDVSGEAVIRRIRELFRDSTPVVAVGTRNESEDAISALSAGADDFVSCDSAPEVLAARIRAVIQRRQAPATLPAQSVRFGEYQIEYATQTVTLRGERIALTPKELDLFWVFVTNFERLLPKAELMACVWGRDSGIDTHTVSQHVYTLRNKLSLARNGLQLAAVYGAGYRLQGRREVAATAAAAPAP